MKAEYLQNGDAIDFVNGSNKKIEAGEVVKLGSRIGVAGTDIAKGALGSVHLNGAFVMPKADSAITIGSDLYFDETNDCVTATKGSLTVSAGYAAADAAATDTMILVRLNG